MEQVDFIDVLKGSTASIYGSRASAGVIAVYTKSGLSAAKQEKREYLMAKLTGYATAREYAEIQQTFTQANLEDIRTTIFWEPKMITNKNGEAKVTFNTTDQLGDYIIIAQGLRADGKPMFGQTKISVE